MPLKFRFEKDSANLFFLSSQLLSTFLPPQNPVNYRMRLPLLLFSGILLLATIGCKKETGGPLVPNEPLPPTPFVLPATQEVVMYEVNLRAFSQAGNLAGVIARLDDIKRLGVNVIWLMPIHPVGVERSVGGLGSPYAVRDYRAVGTEYGSLADLQLLLREAHARDMGVVLDWVANHTAWDHAWITDHPSWYTRDANGTILHPPGTNWLDVADLNFGNDTMRQAMIADMRYWTETVGVDGFRCDAADMVPFDFWKQAIDSLRLGSGNKRLLMLAEGARTNHYSAGFDLNFSWDYYSRLKTAFQTGLGTSSLWNAHLLEYNNTPAGKHRLRFITNHDEYAWDNTPAALFGSDEAAFAAFALTTAMSRVVLIYSGQEIAWPAKIPFFTRAPLNWGTKPAYRQRYESWMQMRKSEPLFAQGDVLPASQGPVSAYLRTSATDTVLVVVNTRNQTDSLALPTEWQAASGWRKLYGDAEWPALAAPYGISVWKRL